MDDDVVVSDQCAVARMRQDLSQDALMLCGMNDDTDAPDDETACPPSVVATDAADLAACDPYASTAHIAPDGRLLDMQTGREIVLRDVADEIHALLIFSRDPTDAQRATIDGLASAAREKRGPAVVLTRVDKGRVRACPGALDVRVAVDVWDHVVGLASVLLEDFTPRSHRPRQRRANPSHWRLRWLLVDPRPAAMISALTTGLTGKRVFVGARLPAAAEPWHMDGEVEPWSAGDQLIFSGDNENAEVLLIEEMTGSAPNTVLREPEVIPHDPRPFNGRLAYVGDVETAARRIAALHLLHDDDLTTEVLIEQCARNRTVHVPVPVGGVGIDEGRRLALGLAVNRLLGQQVFDLVSHE